jgi:hypothetical protein
MLGRQTVRQMTFEVEVEGDPVFLLNTEGSRVERVGFFATRRVDADAADEAGRLACEIVLNELMRKRPRNPPEQPIKIVATKVIALPEGKWGPKRRLEGTFSFFPHEIH